MSPRLEALILAAGYGTRLEAAADGWPKALVPVAGRPFVEHVLDRMVAPGAPGRVVLVVNARDRPRFEAWLAASTAARAVGLALVDNGTRTAAERPGAVGDLALGASRLDPAGPALVLAADTLLPLPLAAMLERLQKDDDALAVVPVIPEPDPAALHRRGIAEVGPGGVLTDLAEKPDRPRGRLTVPPAYLFRPQALALVARYLERRMDPDALGGFVGWLARKRRVLAHPVSGQRLDIGTPEGLARAREALGETAAPRG